MGSLQKIVNLIKKTGDKAIIIDQNGDPMCVVMSVDDYEDLAMDSFDFEYNSEGLTEDEILDRINRDMDFLKESQNNASFLENSDNCLQNFSEEEIGPAPSFNEIPIPNFNDEIPLNLNNNVAEEEDRYYFEPVE